MIRDIKKSLNRNNSRMNNLEIKIEGLTKSYSRPVLKDINLEVTNQSYIAIVGKSGAGKSTFMNILGLIEHYDGGSYTFNSQQIKNGKDYSKLRMENIGFIFQAYNLIPTLTCKENILLPAEFSSKKNSAYQELVERLNIEHLLEQPVRVLSGGEKQRVAIARALILDPALIIADEPTGNLDENNRDIVLSILREEHKKGRAVITITHDRDLANKFDTILTLSDGVLHEV